MRHHRNRPSGRRRRKSAVATQIGIIILVLAVCGILYAALNNVIGQLQTWQQSNYGSGIFGTDIYTFIFSAWFTLLIIASGYVLITRSIFQPKREETK